MRCRAAEPGAVTSTVSGLTSPPSLAYREVRRRSARTAARAPRGAALRTGRKGERNTSPGSGCESTRPVRKNGPVLAKHRGGAPVGAAARSQGPPAHPRTVSMLKVRHSALRSLSLSRDGEKTRRCAPASVERGGGALACFLLPARGEKVASGKAASRMRGPQWLRLLEMPPH